MDKYLKYKNKYIQLKLNQTGGNIEEIKAFLNLEDNYIFDTYENINMINFEYNLTTNSKSRKIVSIKVIKIILDDCYDSENVLVIIPGISHNSFTNTANRILRRDQIIKLKTKFNAIYLFEQDSFKEFQNPICETRDLIIDMVGGEYKIIPNTNSKKFNQIYNPEAALNDKIATFINNILINEFKISSSIYLLGKSNGGWIATLLLEKNDIYNGLFLAIPGIPTGITTLKHIKPERLRSIIFIISWVEEDEFQFSFYGVSNKEKDRYDLQMHKLQRKVGRLNYQSYIDKNGGEPHDKNQHEMYLGMINYIVSII